MIQQGEDLRFPLEPRETIRIESEDFGKNLQRNVAIESDIVGSIDFAHATGADGGGDFVWADTTADRKPHQFFGTRRFNSSNQFCTRIMFDAVSPPTSA